MERNERRQVSALEVLVVPHWQWEHVKPRASIFYLFIFTHLTIITGNYFFRLKKVDGSHQ